MDLLTIFYFIFTFIGLYYLSLFTLIYLHNIKNIYHWIKSKKEYEISIVIPCYNGAEGIEETIKRLSESDYPGLKKIIVVDDCSTDNSYEIIKKCEKIYKKLMVVQTPENTKNAAGAKNYGARFVETELIGFSDDDAYPNKDAISKMVGFFNDPKTGAVTSRVLVQNRKKFLAKLQSIEYKLIAFTRKLFGFIDAIYVTNGPLSIYRKDLFDEVNGFDEKNLTEDIEITWNILSRGWKVHISMLATVYTTAPETFKMWLKQRLRWNAGGIQTILKYKKEFLKKGMIGSFIFPYFVSAWIFGIFGLGLLTYRLSRYIITQYLATSYSVTAQTAVISMSDLSFSPSVLFFFGMALLTLGTLFNLNALAHSRNEPDTFKKENVIDLIVYMFVYLLMYPVVLVASLYKFLKKDYSW
jgi:cellulose synthase/poly-beta-1,6-N-acetylglucosamine synthase-like glycosyltransferase